MMVVVDAPRKKPPSRWKRARRVVLLGALAALALFGAAVVIDGWEAFGKAPEGARRATMEASPQWEEDAFENEEPLWNDALGMFGDVFEVSDHASPESPPEVVEVGADRFATAPASGLRVTWLGHSTLIVEIDGHRFLVASLRCCLNADQKVRFYF